MTVEHEPMTMEHGQPIPPKGQLTGETLALIERAERGLVPADLEVCATLLDACRSIEHAACCVRWMAIAQVKVAHGETEGGRGKRASWIAWVMEHYEEYESKSHIHHMAAVGGFLLRHVKCVSRETHFSAPFFSLLAMSRLPGHLLPRFLEKTPVLDMTADQVRRAVNQWLKAAGEPTPEEESGPKPGHAPKRQADFLDVLFGDVECPDGEALYSQVERRLHDVDLPGTVRTLDRSLCVANAALDRMIEDGDAQTLATYAGYFERFLGATRDAIAAKTGIDKE